MLVCNSHKSTRVANLYIDIVSHASYDCSLRKINLIKSSVFRVVYSRHILVYGKLMRKRFHYSSYSLHVIKYSLETSMGSTNISTTTRATRKVLSIYITRKIRCFVNLDIKFLAVCVSILQILSTYFSKKAIDGINEAFMMVWQMGLWFMLFRT